MSPASLRESWGRDEQDERLRMPPPLEQVRHRYRIAEDRELRTPDTVGVMFDLRDYEAGLENGTSPMRAVGVADSWRHPNRSMGIVDPMHGSATGEMLHSVLGEVGRRHNGPAVRPYQVVLQINGARGFAHRTGVRVGLGGARHPHPGGVVGRGRWHRRRVPTGTSGITSTTGGQDDRQEGQYERPLAGHLGLLWPKTS